MNNERDLLPVIQLEAASTCCGTEAAPGVEEEELSLANQPYLAGEIETPLGVAPVISTKLGFRDTLGGWKARWGWQRMNYRVPPGLYAVGKPDDQSPVITTANYKLSFDAVRRELSGHDVWLLVLDTKGINVWCAAGKGTFGTAELANRIEKTQLHEIVTHRSIIVPQLAAPGVSAHEVRSQTGFRVTYGPVRASDLPAFIQSGLKASPQMRQVRFNLPDRLTLAPVELSPLIKPGLYIIGALLLLNLASALLGRSPLTTESLLRGVLTGIFPIFGAVLTGTILFAALLPYIPGRAFAWKGWLLGLLWAAAYTMLIVPGGGLLQTAAYFLLLPGITAFLSMNFTGSSTYTSMSGVIKEMGIALPAIIISVSLGAAGLIATYFL